MSVEKFPDWIRKKHSQFFRLTDSVELISRNLIKDAGIPFLSINGRTKSIIDCENKAKRKSYKDPVVEMTDISGVRVVVYFDYDVDRVCKIIEQNFNIDRSNSKDKLDVLSVNEVGYRSVHYVCDLGEDRTNLTEYAALKGLRFEFQVRTVLQHAWAELSHDRNYKFNGKLPRQIERKLYLLAGLMETADSGFSDLSKEIDAYIATVASPSENDINIEINSLSLESYIKKWAIDNGFPLRESSSKNGYSDLIDELKQFGLFSINDLKSIIPKDFLEKSGQRSTTIYGLVREWMMIHNPKKFVEDVRVGWVLESDDIENMKKYLTPDGLDLIRANIEVEDLEEEVFDEWDEDI